MGEWMLQPCGAMEPWSNALASVTPRALTASFSCFWHATCVGPGRTRGQHATRVRMHATHVRMHATHVLPDRAEAGPALRMLELEDPSALFLSEKTSFDRSKKPRGSVGASASAPPRQLLLLLLFVSCRAIEAAPKRERTASHEEYNAYHTGGRVAHIPSSDGTYPSGGVHTNLYLHTESLDTIQRHGRRL